MRGIRFRLAATLLALVAVTVAAIGVGTYAFVDGRLREALLDDASSQAQFDLSVLLPGRLPEGATADDFEASGLPQAFRLRGEAGLIVDFGDGRPYVEPTTLLPLLSALPEPLRTTVEAGNLGFAWQQTGQGRVLVVGGRQGDGPAIYLVVDAEPLEATLGQLRLGLGVAGLVALLVALAAAGYIARRILRPIGSGSLAAARMADGDLSVRLPIEGSDELAAWAGEFNRMADSLEATIRRLRSAQDQNRRFVADVSHELRTPLTALVAEASIIEAGLDGLSPDARRAAELLVADIRRLRGLVEDLMELSRFDAAAEQLQLEPVDLGRLVTATVAARLPEASVVVPAEPVVVESDVRRLDRILGNVLDNARVHAPAAPVDVSLGVADGRAVITIADRGPGVDPASLPQLFDRFFKASASRTSTEMPAAGTSSGLGLAIAAEHAALLGATLTAAPRPGGGLVLTFVLPVTRSLPGGDRGVSGEREASAVSEPTPRSGR